MKQEFNLNLSKLLFDLTAINIALGVSNLIVFYTFWVDGWSYPSLFIVINLSTILAFFLTAQTLFNPSYSFRQIVIFHVKYLLIIFLFVTIYWLFVLDRKYYLVHLLIFYSLTVLFIIFFKWVWIKIFFKVLQRLYSPKNIMIVSRNRENLQQTILKNKWLKYSIEQSLSEIVPDDLTLYINQYNLDLIMIDLKGKAELKESLESIGRLNNVTIIFLNPVTKTSRLKKIIGDYEFYT